MLAQSPQNFVALHLLGVLMGQVGNLTEGIGLLRQAVSIRPNSPEAQTDLGEMLRRAGELDAAAAACLKAIAMNRRHAPAHFNLGLTRLTQQRSLEAMQCFKAAAELTPNSADAWHAVGLAAQAQELSGEALAAYERALVIAPKRIETLCVLASVLAELGNTKQATDHYETALKIRRDYLPAIRGLAMAIASSDPERAVSLIRSGLVLAPNDGEMRETLGNILRQHGHFEEAVESYRAALELSGAKAGRCYGLAHSKKFDVSDEPALARFKSALDESVGDARACSTIHFALGKVLDDLGRYDEAMRNFERANALWLESRPEHRKQIGLAAMRKAHSAMVDGLIDRFDVSEINQLRQWAQPSDKPIFILGMMRSGTTLVEQILASHPEVAACGELRFWTDLLSLRKLGTGGELSEPDARRAVDDYLTVLNAAAPDAVRATDKMPNNFLVLGLVRALLPGAKLIHCRRDPVDTCLSIFFTQFASRHEYAYDRDAIVDFYEDYLRLMTHWRHVLPNDAFLEIDYEQLVQSPEEVTQKILAYCGLDRSKQRLAFSRMPGAITTASAWQARQPIYRSAMKRSDHYKSWLGPFERLSAKGGDAVKSAPARLIP